MKAVIIKNREEIKRIRSGKQTMLRQVMLPQPAGGICYRPYKMPGDWIVDFPAQVYKPVYQPGNTLYIREKWSIDGRGRFVYYADYSDDLPPDAFKWRPPQTMPQRAARIFLKVKAIKAERLQQGDGTDTKEFAREWDEQYAAAKPVRENGRIVCYRSFPWEEIEETREYKGEKWEVFGNPWVWIVDFELIGNWWARAVKE